MKSSLLQELNNQIEMEHSALQINPDLKRFIDKFQPKKYKILTSGIEIRGIVEIRTHIIEAEILIKEMKLNLTTTFTPEMGSYGAFEVNIKK